MVNLTSIYTRTGDDGTTSLGDFSRVSKTDPRLLAYADANEANAAIGVAVVAGGAAFEVLAQRGLERIARRFLDPSAGLHGLDHDRRGVAGGGLRDDPATQLGGDQLGGAHARILPEAGGRQSPWQRAPALSGNRGCG